jgi:hypothetical protein
VNQVKASSGQLAPSSSTFAALMVRCHIEIGGLLYSELVLKKGQQIQCQVGQSRVVVEDIKESTGANNIYERREGQSIIRQSR